MYLLILTFLISVSALQTAPQDPAPITNRYADIEKAYAGMFEKQAQNYHSKKNKHQKKEAKKDPFKTLPELSYEERLTTTLAKIKTQVGDADILPQTTIASPDVWKNLEIFTNASHMPEKTIVGRIKRTYTTAGEVVLTRILLDPLTDVKVLKERQAFIKKLLTDEALYTTIQTKLSLLKQEESSLLSLAHAKDPVYSTILDTITSQLQAGSFDGTKHFSAAVYSTILPLSSATLLAGGIHQVAKGALEKDLEKATIGGIMGIAGAAKVGLIINGIVQLINLSKKYMYLHRRLESISTLLKTVEQINLIQKDLAFSEIKTLSKNYIAQNGIALENLRKATDNSTFKSIPKPGKVMGWGNVLSTSIINIASAYREMKNALPVLYSGLTLVGHLDAYFSIARLIKESKVAHWCFVTYVENSKNPLIEAKHFWHPSIAAEHAVTNSIKLGTEQNPQAVVITGVNTGGKSTAMKALALCCILGQTIGIAPAQKLTFTPFSCINTYLNITDNLGKNLSLFKAELLRAQILIKQFQALKPHEFCFTILDEICTGTERVEGEALAYSVALKLGKSANAITILASHFPGLSELAIDHKEFYKNMKVVALIDENKDFTYPYKLLEGATTQQIAPDLLEKSGLPLTMTQKMRDILNNPEKYTYQGEI